LERVREVGALILVERSRRHDHSGRAEAALKSLRVEKGALHRMQRVLGGKSLERGDRAAGGAEGRHQAGMNRGAVEPDRARAAIAGVAALLHAEEAALAQERAQALPGLRLGGYRLAVDGAIHDRAPGGVSSARVCSAK